MEIGDVLNIKMSSPETLRVNFGSGPGGTRDYNRLYNKPSINGVELVGDLTFSDLGIKDTLTGSTEHWTAQRDFIPAYGQIVIYSDKETVVDQDGNEQKVPGIKIGDGNAYLADLPWVGGESTAAILETLENHIHNKHIHVTDEERAAWNSKVDVRIDEHNHEIIEFFR